MITCFAGDNINYLPSGQKTAQTNWGDLKNT